MNNTQTKANNQQQKPFAAILEEIMQGAAPFMGEDGKKQMDDMLMSMAIEEALDEIREDLSQHGDMIFGSTEITKCPCPRNCGAVKIEVDFTAYKFLPHGIGVTKGEVEHILSRK